MFPVVIEAASGGPTGVVLVYYVSQIILVAVAVCTLVASALALRQSASARRGALLLQLDDRFESQGMKSARNLLRTTDDAVRSVVTQAHIHATDEAKEVPVRNEWAKQLDDMRINKPDDYMDMLVYAGFIESLGRMVKRNYISLEDVVSLFEDSILSIERAFRLHAQHRMAAGEPKGLLENAFDLANRTKKMAAKEAARQAKKAAKF